MRASSRADLIAAILLPFCVRAADSLTTIHLDQYNGYFAARETLAGLRPGEYEFVVSNKVSWSAEFDADESKRAELEGMFREVYSGAIDGLAGFLRVHPE